MSVNHVNPSLSNTNTIEHLYIASCISLTNFSLLPLDLAPLRSLTEPLSLSAIGSVTSCSNAAAVPTQTFPNLDAALTFWVKSADEILTTPPITIAPGEDLDNVLRFLRRLTETAEYKNPKARPVLAMRVIDALRQMAEDASIKDRAFEIIQEGLISCDDRIIDALEEIELMVLLHQIETTSHTETELKALGRRFLLLEMVNEKAKAYTSTLKWVDELEVYLAFRIGLAEKLNLPVKTRHMSFRRCSQVTDKQINQARDAVLSECTEEKLNNFLKSWSPWIKHQKKTATVPAYEDLPVTARNLASSDICPITRDVPVKPVLCGNVNVVYDYDALVQCYRTNGSGREQQGLGALS
jgi:E3 ligase-like protein (putative virulence factor)